MGDVTAEPVAPPAIGATVIESRGPEDRDFRPAATHSATDMTVPAAPTDDLHRHRGAPLSQRENTLTVVDLHKSYGHRQVLRGARFELREGELLGIIGENGAGKSTLLGLLAGALKADRGKISRRGDLGYCPQRIVVNDDLTVEQHLRYFQCAYHLESLDRATELVERLGLSQYADTKAGTLSGGTKQKLNLTLALMHDPRVVLMDEPYQGFDWDNYLNFWAITTELRDRGCSVLVISHIAHDTERFDRLLRLEAGLVVPAEPVGIPAGRAKYRQVAS
jgi:ABC-2 type transport system ATP-binding protein